MCFILFFTARGPLVKEGVQIGIVSFGYGCGQRSYPAMYTRLCTYMPWLKSHVDSLPTVGPCDYFYPDEARYVKYDEDQTLLMYPAPIVVSESSDAQLIYPGVGMLVLVLGTAYFV